MIRPTIRVGIDAMFMQAHHHDGGAVALEHLLAHLNGHANGMEFTVFVDPRSVSSIPSERNFRIVPVRLPQGPTRVAVRFAWENTMLRREARRHRIDVMFFPANLVPARFPTRTVLLTHDFSSLFYRDRMPELRLPLRNRILDFERVRSCRRADAVLAVSDFSASEITRHTGLPQDRITVAYLGVRDLQVPDAEAAHATVQRYGVSRPFLLAVSSLRPNKNLPRLVEAFASSADAELSSFDLVLVGSPGGDQGEIGRAIEEHGMAGRVVLPGFVPDEDLPAFYRAAEVFVLPSLYEGFGLPVLEAGACGTAVAAGRAGSLPEVLGDAGLLFDPWDVGDMARKLRTLAASPTLRDELGRKGRARAAQFSWERTAGIVTDTLREVAGRQVGERRR